jgi:hypothetical protein
MPACLVDELVADVATGFVVAPSSVQPEVMTTRATDVATRTPALMRVTSEARDELGDQGVVEVRGGERGRFRGALLP